MYSLYLPRWLVLYSALRQCMVFMLSAWTEWISHRLLTYSFHLTESSPGLESCKLQSSFQLINRYSGSVLLPAF